MDSNKKMTKKEVLKGIYEIEEETSIIIEGNTQRVNISLNSGLWNRIPAHINKSKLVEKLLRLELEKHYGKRITLRKSIL